MVSGLGFNIRLLFTYVFAFGTAVAGLAGVLGAARSPASGPGLDFEVLITTLDRRASSAALATSPAFWASCLLIGLAETYGKAVYPAAASFIIFGLMAVVPVHLRRRPRRRGYRNERRRHRSERHRRPSTAPLIWIPLGYFARRPSPWRHCWDCRYSFKDWIIEILDVFAARAWPEYSCSDIPGLVSFGHAAFFAIAGYVVAAQS